MTDETNAAVSLRVLLLRHICLNPFELFQGGFLNVDAVGGDSDRLVGRKAAQHRQEVYVGVGQHACSQVGVLGLRAVVVCEDVAEGAPLRCAYQGAALAGVSHEEVQLSMVGHKPPGQPFAISLVALGELPYDAWSRSSGSQTSVCFSKAIMTSRTFRLFRRPDSTMKARRAVGAQPCSAKCFPNQTGMTG